MQRRIGGEAQANQAFLPGPTRLPQPRHVAGEAGRIEIAWGDPHRLKVEEARHHQLRQLLPDGPMTRLRPVEGHELLTLRSLPNQQVAPEGVVVAEGPRQPIQGSEEALPFIPQSA